MIPQEFLDQLQERSVMSALVGRSVKLTKVGREWKACCPVHGEKTPSFTVNDEKGFAHCFGCGFHAGPIRWLTDREGLSFIDAVRELAALAGMELPAPTPAEAQRAAKAATVRECLDAAQVRFAAQLAPAGAVVEYLAARGIDGPQIARFGIGYARGSDGSLKGLGLGQNLLAAAGLIAAREDGSLREVFHDRITVPIHDARGGLVGFGGRVWPGRRGDTPKFVNSPEGPLFDKGRTLFNLHRAAPAARSAAANRLLVVEGYFDVIALDRIGIAEAVAPMGTALTEAQLDRAWRVHPCPVLLFDGDGAGRRAALRAAQMAMPLTGPGRGLSVALLPDGLDPDDLAQAADGRAKIEAVLAGAQALDDFVFAAALEGEL